MRKSGILMHITSLPNPYGIGTLGKCAYDFVDFLHRSGQSYWQILPLCPTGYGDSPYQSFSTFAGNHYLIDLDLLIDQGLLTREEAEEVQWCREEDRVDYGCLYHERNKILRLAYSRFQKDEDFQTFRQENQDWLEDFSLFMALKNKFNGSDWQSWSVGLLMRIPEALASYRLELEEEMEFQAFQQYLFFGQWQNLHNYAKEKGIQIIGDVPIYVPLDSADVWSNHELFQLDAGRRPRSVAGCPPDSFTADGQLWGNPLYNWDKIRETGYDWWIRRLRAAGKLYDVIRLDHFRGFESYWSVPAGETTAINGQWVKGPGMDFVRAIQKALPDLEFIAEDLGYLTQEVKDLVADSGWPGMKVMEFAFDSREQGDYLPHLYPVNSFCYSGTHDNLTMKQWFEDALESDVAEAKAYLGLHEEEGLVWGMIRGCMASVSKTAIIQMQDYLELGGQARMNAPGTLSDRNWSWRALPDTLTDTLAEKIRQMTARFGRIS